MAGLPGGLVIGPGAARSELNSPSGSVTMCNAGEPGLSDRCMALKVPSRSRNTHSARSEATTPDFDTIAGRRLAEVNRDTLFRRPPQVFTATTLDTRRFVADS